MKLSSVIGLVALLSIKALAANNVILDQRLIQKLIDENPPSIEQAQASFLAAKQQHLSKSDQLGFRLEGQTNYFESKERLLGNFDGGVTRRLNDFTVGVVKPTQYGVQVGAKVFGQKVTNAFLSNASTAGVTLSLSIDLYQDIFGRRTKNDLKRSELSVERAKLEKEINLGAVSASLYKLYWSLVANNEQKILLTKSVSFAKRQYEEAVKRRKSGIADAGEVARYHSQWTSRKASLLSLRYRRGEIVKALKEQLPQLNGKEVELAPYSVNKTIEQVLECSFKIASYPESPLEFTKYDEIVNLLKKEEQLENKVINTYDNPSLKLVGEYSSVGRDFSMSDSRSNLSDDGQARTSLGLQFSVPFGEGKAKTQEVAKKVAKLRYHSQVEANYSKIKAFHSETAKLILILKDVVRNQRETNLYLSKSLQVTRKKYKQARIRLQELISEEDAQLQSSLDEVQTNLTIINTLLDYFSIYNKIPCEFNRIK